jgi:hypothetical protein
MAVRTLTLSRGLWSCKELPNVVAESSITQGTAFKNSKVIVSDAPFVGAEKVKLERDCGGCGMRLGHWRSIKINGVPYRIRICKAGLEKFKIKPRVGRVLWIKAMAV